jgi:hypothetical protein
MCGRVRLASDYSEIKIRLKFAPDSPAPNFEPDWNKPPTMPMLVALRSEDAHLRRFGLSKGPRRLTGQRGLCDSSACFARRACAAVMSCFFRVF